MKPADIKTHLFRYLKSRSEVRLAYLFGSQVSGGANRLSDIDIALWVDESRRQKMKRDPYGYKAKILTECMKILKSDNVDLVVLNQAPYFLRHRVITGGKPIFIRSEKERVRFEADIMNRYPDLKRFLGIHWQ